MKLALNEIPEDFLEWTLKEQQEFLTDRFKKIGKLEITYRRLLGIVRGGTKLTKDDFKQKEHIKK